MQTQPILKWKTSRLSEVNRSTGAFHLIWSEGLPRCLGLARVLQDLSSSLPSSEAPGTCMYQQNCLEWLAVSSD